MRKQMMKSAIKAPWYRKMRPNWPDWHVEETLTPADESASGWRLADYYKMQEIVSWLPTVKEKIDFVNPYEREWGLAERTWHRKYMPPLMAARKAWALPPIPPYFDSLDFYKFVTKCRLVSGEEADKQFQKYYDTVQRLPTRQFEEFVRESLSVLRPNLQSKECRAKFLRSLVDGAQLFMVPGNKRVLDYRISHASRCESFWIRAGFRHLYEHLPVWEEPSTEPDKNKLPRFTGDDRRRLGELCFTMRDEHVVQVRQREPMRNIFEWENNKELLEAPLFPTDVNPAEDILYSPKMFNLLADPGILWQCPGYEYDSDETHMFGRLAIKDISALVQRMDEWWRPESDYERSAMLEEGVRAVAVSSLFNWLNGQAHCLGNTQFTDLERPLTSQMVFSDGHQSFWFALAQLNTIATNIDVEGFHNPRTNVCFIEGPFRLYQGDIDANSKLDQHVLHRLLQMSLVAR